MHISRFSSTLRRIDLKLKRHATERQVRSSMRLLHGPEMTRLKDDQVALIIVGRDVSYFLEHHIRHHLALGISHVVYIDNESTDKSVEIVKQFPNITIASCTADFRVHQRWIRFLASTRFLQGGWRLAIDPDELLDYPQSSRIDLPELTRRMSARGHTALIAQMLDMAYDGPLSETSAMNFSEAELRFDRFSLAEITERPDDSPFLQDLLKMNRFTNPNIRFLFGGLRRAAFGENCCLTKHALFRMEKGVVPHPHPHVTTGVVCTDFSAVLKHYKFAGGILDRERKLLSERRLSHGEAKMRVAKIGREGDINLSRYAESREPTVDELIEKGFLKASREALRMLA